MNILFDFYKSLTTFEPIHKNYSVPLSDYKYSYELPFERIDSMYLTEMLQLYWQHTISVSIVYYILIRFIQWYMRNKKGFELRYPLIIWNTALALFSVLGLVRFGEEYFASLFNRGLYNTICATCNRDGVPGSWCFIFIMSKFVEMGDTMFIVLRKKPLIFLHYYHHVVVLIYAVHSGAEHATPGRTFIIMNLFAHSIMYSYYTARAIGYRPPIFVAATITILQTVQMIIGVLVSVGVYYIKSAYNWRCQQSFPNLYLGFFIYATFASLFIQFFVARYIRLKNKHTKID